MKKLLTAIAAIALIGTPAFAADIAVKAPPLPPPAPVYNWTGWYVGGNVGASFGTFKTDFNAAPVLIGGNPFVPVSPGFGFSDTEYPGGFVGGGQIGFNWQFSPIWVVGLEADFQGIDNKESSTQTNNFSIPSPDIFGGAIINSTTVTDFTTQINWFGTARVRAGYLFGDGTVMTYVTGGLAYGEVKINGTSIVSGNSANPPPAPIVPFSATTAFSHSQVRTGWVVGSGTEGKLLIPGWTYKIEALYMDLGHLDATGVGSGLITGGFLDGFHLTAGATTHTHITDTILRAGLNYQFH
jgi:outer membrane immunogenic protein